MCSPLIYPFHQSHSLHPNFYDRILEWLEDSYLKNIHNKDEVVFALFLLKYLGSTHYMIFLDPPCEEIDEYLENCQEDGELRPWLMVMSGPHYDLLTLFHSIMTHIMTRLQNGWRIHTSRSFKRMVRSCLFCF
jgi:hypothetical protein